MKRISKTEIKEMRSQSKKNSIMFAFTLPTVILYTIFFLVTMLIGVYYSFTDWNGISKDYTFVGLKNYVKVLTDERFREALWFNIGYTIALVVLLIVIPLTIALALNRIRRLAMESAGLWMLPTYKENPLPFEWDVVRMPMDKNQNTKAGILNWGISKSTKNPEAAWDLLKFLCGAEGNRIVAESNMALPGSTDKEALQIVLDSKFPSNVKAFVDSVPDCDLKDQLSIYRTEVNTKVQQLVDEMLIGKSTPEETQEKLIKEINAILAN